MQIAKLARDLLAMCPEPFSSWLKPITTSLARTLSRTYDAAASGAHGDRVVVRRWYAK